MPKVSVIIPCFNAESWIRETLESVFQQKSQDLETIVVDDGSTDSSARLVEEEFPSVRLMRIGNGGPSRARNTGTKIASGEFIQYLDSDDLLAPDKIRVQLEALDASGADVAYGDWRDLIQQNEGVFCPGTVFQNRIEGEPEAVLLWPFWAPIMTYLFRRSFIEKVRGWNESMWIVEDVRFLLDCAMQGASFIYCPKLMGCYRRTSASLSNLRMPQFAKRCLRNANHMQKQWLSHGGITEERKRALLGAYQQVARSSYRKDGATFELAYRALEGLCPGFVPKFPPHLRAVSRWIGYRNAEEAAYHYRRVKRIFRVGKMPRR